MPEDGIDVPPDSHLLQRHEISTLATMFAKLGVKKVWITGGEPTVRKDWLDIIRDLNSIEGIDDIGITTNGLTLKWKLG